VCGGIEAEKKHSQHTDDDILFDIIDSAVKCGDII
jgi:hypothetical protein